MEIWRDIWVQYGALGILLVVLVWIMFRREADLKDNHRKTTDLLEGCQDEKQVCLEHLIEQRKELLDVIRKNRDEIMKLHEKQLEVIENNTRVVSHVVDVIRACQRETG